MPPRRRLREGELFDQLRPVSQAQLANEPMAVELAHARAVAAIYADAEEALFKVLADRVAKGLDEPDYEARRLAEVKQLRREADATVRKLEKLGEQAARDGVSESWQRGVDKATKDLRQLGNKKLINPGQGVAQLAEQAVAMIRAANEGALRAVPDIFRQVVAETAGRTLVGAETRRQAAQRALDRFADKGISGFTDSRGRTWNLTSYVEMAIRTATGRAAVDGHLATLRDAGHDLVIVSRAPRSCPLCEPWEGQVLTQEGAPGVRRVENTLTGELIEVHVKGTVTQARAAGFQHANCRHSLSIYLPGVTRPPAKVPDTATYADTQKQRALERQVRHWKRRQAAAMDEPSRKRAAAKVAEYQAQLKQHTAATGLRRKPAREQISRAI